MTTDPERTARSSNRYTRADRPPDTYRDIEAASVDVPRLLRLAAQMGVTVWHANKIGELVQVTSAEDGVR
jgi:hypothetical protein